MNFHLLYEQPIFFKDNEDIDEILNFNEHKRTMFLAWFEANKIYPLGKKLTYCEYPRHFFGWQTEESGRQGKLVLVLEG